ncbi:hypothetical protein GCM10027419_29610 [Pandoraea terrae]
MPLRMRATRLCESRKERSKHLLRRTRAVDISNEFPRLQRRTLALIAVIAPLLGLFIYAAVRPGPLASYAVTVANPFSEAELSSIAWYSGGAPRGHGRISMHQ